MLFQLNYKSGKAVYLQLVDQVKAAAAAGAIGPGESLPSIRPLAEELRVNRNTIAKAYAQLESLGVIETIAGKGCFVRKNGSPFRKDVRLKLLADAGLGVAGAAGDPVVRVGRVALGRAGHRPPVQRVAVGLEGR